LQAPACVSSIYSNRCCKRVESSACTFFRNSDSDPWPKKTKEVGIDFIKKNLTKLKPKDELLSGSSMQFRRCRADHKVLTYVEYRAVSVWRLPK
jgi:hypothetical protein